MAGKEEDGKWKGEVTEVIAAPIGKVWAILSDFDGLHRLFPQIFSSCKTIEGEKNKPGSVRALTAPLPDGSQTVEAHERLISVDDVNHTTSYGIDWINLGWTGYTGNIDAKSVENGHTQVLWSFELDPVDNVTEEMFVKSQKALFAGILSCTKGLVAE